MSNRSFVSPSPLQLLAAELGTIAEDRRWRFRCRACGYEDASLLTVCPRHGRYYLEEVR